ncbi:hypothetical protein H6G04_06615 [Calothrix membranacea FACHB-236]|nr:hypothetical protein [Calothrix membranacea FACHB-236]
MNINKIMRSLFSFGSTFVTLTLTRQRLLSLGYASILLPQAFPSLTFSHTKLQAKI